MAGQLHCLDEKECRLVDAISSVLAQLDREDSAMVYQAIVRAKPGGLGKVDSMDVHHESPPSLLDAMHDASRRDQVAAEYVSNYQLTRSIAKRLLGDVMQGKSWSDAICDGQLWLLSEQGDSLIRRKNGDATDCVVRSLGARPLMDSN